METFAVTELTDIMMNLVLIMFIVIILMVAMIMFSKYGDEGGISFSIKDLYHKWNKKKFKKQ